MAPSHPPTSAPVSPGEVLAGKFKVERVLGAGGMGVVVAARHLELDERVAVKFLHPEAMLSGEAGARFVREARAAVKIKSEHVARVIDVGRLENGAPYIVMEYLEGSDLAARVDQGPLSIEDAVDYVVQACDAMAEAHALGIVHRDLKPANLFLIRRSDGAGLVKVLDFGISKVQVPDTADAGLTKTSAVMGSPFYMSPEQMKSSKDVDSRTDVWSLGVILYELLAGRPPFQGDTLPELLSAIMLEPPPPLQSLRSEIPLPLAAVLTKVLQKDRTQRYQNVGELASALAPFAPRRTRHTLERVIKLSGGVEAPAPHSERPGVNAQVPVAARTASAWSETGQGQPAKSSRAGLLIGIAAAAALVAGGGVLLFVRAPSASPEAAASAAPTPPPPAAAAIQAPAPALAVDPPQPTAAPSSVAPSPATPAPPVPPAAAPPQVSKAAVASKPGPAKAAAAAEKPAPVAAAPAPAPPAPDPSPLTAPPKAETPPAAPKRSGLKIDLK
jgi:eukaryotic-like serine/threonine-protein kinase